MHTNDLNKNMEKQKNIHVNCLIDTRFLLTKWNRAYAVDLAIVQCVRVFSLFIRAILEAINVVITAASYEYNNPVV